MLRVFSPHNRLPQAWIDPSEKWVIGFSFQLAINQHQFALHALGYCHLDKDTGSKIRKAYSNLLFRTITTPMAFTPPQEQKTKILSFSNYPIFHEVLSNQEIYESY